MQIDQAIVLGLVQGVTAWIPVSSKTQVLLAGSALYSLPFQTAISYALLLHLGDLLAALYRYRVEYLQATKLFFQKPASAFKFDASKQNDSSFLIVSVLATAALALPLYLLVKNFFSSLSGEPLLFAVGLLLVAMSLVTFYSHKKLLVHEQKVSLKTALFTGFSQALAVIPGISRSGITQCSLLLQGVRPEKAVRLSFLMAAPMIAAAFAAFYFVEGFSGFSAEAIAAGIAVSALASLATMHAVTQAARRIPSHYFLFTIGLLATLPFLIKSLLGISAG